MRLKNLSTTDLDLPVLRYFTLPKFLSLLSYQALWFPKLSILQDGSEGTLPQQAKAFMKNEAEKCKAVFNTPELHQQIDEWSQRNEADGRELLVVSCWFLGERESNRMWSEYAHISEGVLIRSTVSKLMRNVYDIWPERSYIGRVQYVDYAGHVMTLYDANQAHERAFLKASHFNHEQELRIVTANLKHPHCVSPEGRFYTKEQCSGKDINNSESPGLYVIVDLKKLINSVTVAPKATPWFKKMITRIFEMSKLQIPVLKSELQG